MYVRDDHVIRAEGGAVGKVVHPDNVRVKIHRSPFADSHLVNREKLLAVVVPIADAGMSIVPGSACVAAPIDGSNLWDVYYEGDVYNTGMTFDDKLLHAAGRLIQRYPTIARMVLAEPQLLFVGLYDYETKTLDVESREVLDGWRGVPPTSG